MGYTKRIGKEQENIESRRCWKHPATGQIWIGDSSMDTLPPRGEENKPYTIYVLIDPRTQEVRYVGITYDVYVRFAQHIRGRSNNPKKNAWIRELREAQQMVIMRSIETATSFENALIRETYWIQYYLKSGAKLTNLAGTSKKKPQAPNPNQRCYSCCQHLRKINSGLWSCSCGQTVWSIKSSVRQPR